MSHSISMIPERWQRLQSLFDEALRLDHDSRAQFIATSYGDDVSLREQLLSLVMTNSSDDQTEACLDRAIAATMLRSNELKPGHVIGRYKVV